MSGTVTFNGVDLSEQFVISDVSRPLPEFKPMSTACAGRDGEYFDGMTLGVRECSLSLIAADTSRKGVQDAARALMDVFAVREPKALTFSDEVDTGHIQLTRYAVPTGAFSAREFVKAGKWEVRFVQHDPYLYGQQRYTLVRRDTMTPLHTGGNATVYPIVTATPYAGTSKFDICLAEPGASGSFAIVKRVEYDARYLDGTSGSGFDGSNEITVDMGAETVSLIRSPNDYQKALRGLTLDSRFFGLEGGCVLYSYYANATVGWRERWL